MSSTLANYCNNPQCCQSDPQVRQNYIHACQKKYGYDNIFQVPEKKLKIANTNIMKYGVPVPAKSKIILEKMQQTCLNRYGVTNVFARNDIIAKIHTPIIEAKRNESKKNTIQKRYGVDWYVQTDDFKKKVGATYGKSQEEKELVSYIESICTYEIIVGSFKIIHPKQLDVYIPALKLAFEFNGTYYHSIEHDVDISKHIMKTKMCEAKGIKLVHIWEDDWCFRKNECKKLIKSYIENSIFPNKYACTLLSVDRSKFNQCFFNDCKFIKLTETPPAIVLRAKKDKSKYKVPDCGKLIYLRIPVLLEYKKELN